MKIATAQFAELQKLCRRSFPERLEQRISPVAVSSAGRWPGMTMLLSWRDGRHTRVERLLLRRYADRWTWWSVDDQTKARREWVLMRWLYGLGWPIPCLYASGADDGKPFLLMAAPQGRRCAPTPERVAELASLLARLHRLTPPPEVSRTLALVTVDDELRRLESIAQECRDEGLEEAVKELSRTEVQEYPPCVLHGDPSVEGMLCDARGITAITHWENGALGDPRWDVGRAVAYLRHADNGLAKHFGDLYRERSERSLADLTLWETLAAVQCWGTLAWACESGGRELAALRDRWGELAWRALTRLRHQA